MAGYVLTKVDKAATPKKSKCNRPPALRNTLRQNTTEQVRAIAANIRAVANQLVAQKSQQYRQDRERAAREKLTMWAAIAAAAFAAISAWIFQGQLSEMRNEQRPWVKDTSINIERLEVQKDQILVWVTFKLTNIGHSPTLKVSVLPKLLIPALEPWSFREARRSCDEVKQHPNLVIGKALFPNETDSETINFGRPLRDIWRGRDTWIEETYSSWVKGFGKSEADKFLPTIARMANFMTFSVVGCAAYTFGDSSDVHGTSFALRLDRSPEHPDTRDGGKSFGIDVSTQGVVDGKELRLSPELLGRYAD